MFSEEKLFELVQEFDGQPLLEFFIGFGTVVNPKFAARCQGYVYDQPLFYKDGDQYYWCFKFGKYQENFGFRCMSGEVSSLAAKFSWEFFLIHNQKGIDDDKLQRLYERQFESSFRRYPSLRW